MRSTTAILLGASGLLLSLAAIYSQAQSRRIAARHPPGGRFVDTRYGRLHVLTAGAGVPVLLLHGNVVTAEDWDTSGMIDALAKDHRVIAPDRPGYGHSERSRGRHWTPKAQAEAIAEALETLGVGPAIVVGHSLGTQVALRLAIHHPNLVRRLVLISGYYFPTTRLDGLAVSPAATPGLGDVIRRTVGPIAGRLAAKPLLKAMFSPMRPPLNYEDRVYEQCLRPRAMRACVADGAAMAQEAAGLQGHYAGLSSPITVMTGDADRIVDPVRQSHAFSTAAPIASLVSLAGGGHMVHHQNRDAIVAAIIGEDEAPARRMAPTPPLDAV